MVKSRKKRYGDNHHNTDSFLEHFFGYYDN